MAGFVGLKPSQCVSCMSISGLDLWKTLLRLDQVAESSCSVWTTELRVQLSDLSQLIHSPEAQTFWKGNRRSYLLQQGRTGGGSTTIGAKGEPTSSSAGFGHDDPGARELVSMSWIINATKNVLGSLYEAQSGEIPHDLTLYQELVSLKESLETRSEHIELCLQDLHSLHFFEELQGVYRSEILLLMEMISGESEETNGGAGAAGNKGEMNRTPHRSQAGQQRTEEEYIFTLSKICHRQFEIEAKISNRATPTQHSALQLRMTTPVKERRSPMSSMGSSGRRAGRGEGLEWAGLMNSPSRRKSTSNSLHLLLQNVFPAENLQKRAG
jgi:hypothetical protein